MPSKTHGGRRALTAILAALTAALVIFLYSCADRTSEAETENGAPVTVEAESGTDTADPETDDADDAEKDEKDKDGKEKDKDSESDKESDKKEDKETKKSDKETEKSDKETKTPETTSKKTHKTPVGTTKSEDVDATGKSGGTSGKSGSSSSGNSGSSSSGSSGSGSSGGSSSGGNSGSSGGSSSGGNSGSSGGGSGSSGGSSSGGTTPSPYYGLNTDPNGNIHCYASAPGYEYEDTSNTLSYYPLRQEGATDPGGVYNRPVISESQIKPGVLIQGSADWATTLVGYDGFLFCQDTFHDYDGTSLYIQQRLDNLVKGMVQRNEWVESMGKKMYIVFIPNKNSVYPEYMPSSDNYGNTYSMGSYRRIDQVTNALRANGITVIDARESLLAAKAAAPQRSLYYKTDTHWNNHGGYEVYKQLMGVIQKDFPNAVFHPRSDYQINYAETFMKDQAYCMGYYDAVSEPGSVYTLKSGQTARFTYKQPRDTWGQWAFCYQWPNGYSDHLYYHKWQNDYNSSAPKMYMLRDSYSVALIPFLKDSFSQSTYNWSYYFSRSDIQKSGADVIIIEVVEKNITDFLGQTPLG